MDEQNDPVERQRIRCNEVFGFLPVVGDSALRRTQRALERAIVAGNLAELKRLIGITEQAELMNDAQRWMEPLKRVGDSYQAHKARLTSELSEAEELARFFGLHPDQPFKQE